MGIRDPAHYSIKFNRLRSRREGVPESVEAEREKLQQETSAYLLFGFRFAFGLALSAFSAAKGWSFGSGGVVS